jgi:hypothetical protein
MRTPATTALLLLVPILAFADKYGIDEAMSDSGPITGWLLPLAFVALLVYHLHDHSKLDDARARESFEHEQTSKRLYEARSSLAAMRLELEQVKARYAGMHAGVQQYFEGLTTDEEFASTIEPYLDPIEYTVHKAPEA